MVSYIDKNKIGKRNILTLTTMHDKILTSIDERNKDQCIGILWPRKGWLGCSRPDFSKIISKNENKKMNYKCSSLHVQYGKNKCENNGTRKRSTDQTLYISPHFEIG